MEKTLKYDVKWRPWIKLLKIWKMQPHGIIVKYCSGMLKIERERKPGLFTVKDKIKKLRRDG